MILSPKTQGNRPRLACEIAAGGVVAARSPAPGAPLTAVARVELAESAVLPSLKPGNVADRVATISALRRALEQIGARPNARNTDLTLVIPDGAVRVLLLDFDALPSKLSEALPIVRFRLKKLVPFDTDEAMVTFQVMSSVRGTIRVLAVAIPRDVLSDYETVAREAGFEPGAVLPSTLAAIAGLTENEAGTLAINVYPSAVTTVIVRNGVLLLHRTVELTESAAGMPISLPAALAQPAVPGRQAQDELDRRTLLPLVDREDSAGEWAAQEPAPEFGRNPYADAISAETATESDTMQALFLRDEADGNHGASLLTPLAYTANGRLGGEPAPVGRSPYAATGVTDDLRAEIHNSFLTGVPSGGNYRDGFAEDEPQPLSDLAALGADDDAPPVHTLEPGAKAEEIARAVSVAVAYFEDVLSTPPEILLSAGPLGAEELARTLEEGGLLQQIGLRCRELVDPSALASEATTAAVPRSLLAGVVGALRS